MKKKIVSWLLAIVPLATLLPTFAIAVILIFTGCNENVREPYDELINNCANPRRGITSPLADEIGLSLEISIDPPCFCRWNIPDFVDLVVRNISDFPIAPAAGSSPRIEYFDGDTWAESKYVHDGIYAGLGHPGSLDGRELYPRLRMRPPQEDATEFAPGRYRVVFSLWYVEFMVH